MRQLPKILQEKLSCNNRNRKDNFARDYTEAKLDQSDRSDQNNINKSKRAFITSRQI